MRWPFGRKSPSTDSPAPAVQRATDPDGSRTVRAAISRPAGEWRSLPAIQRTVGEAPLTAPTAPFQEDLDLRRPAPTALAPLGHEVSPLAEPGLVIGLATTVPAHEIATPRPQLTLRPTVQRQARDTDEPQATVSWPPAGEAAPAGVADSPSSDEPTPAHEAWTAPTLAAPPSTPATAPPTAPPVVQRSAVDGDADPHEPPEILPSVGPEPAGSMAPLVGVSRLAAGPDALVAVAGTETTAPGDPLPLAPSGSIDAAGGRDSSRPGTVDPARVTSAAASPEPPSPLPIRVQRVAASTSLTTIPATPPGAEPRTGVLSLAAPEPVHVQRALADTHADPGDPMIHPPPALTRVPPAPHVQRLTLGQARRLGLGAPVAGPIASAALQREPADAAGPPPPASSLPPAAVQRMFGMASPSSPGVAPKATAVSGERGSIGERGDGGDPVPVSPPEVAAEPALDLRPVQRTTASAGSVPDGVHPSTEPVPSHAGPIGGPSAPLASTLVPTVSRLVDRVPAISAAATVGMQRSSPPAPQARLAPDFGSPAGPSLRRQAGGQQAAASPERVLQRSVDALTPGPPLLPIAAQRLRQGPDGGPGTGAGEATLQRTPAPFMADGPFAAFDAGRPADGRPLLVSDSGSALPVGAAPRPLDLPRLSLQRSATRGSAVEGGSPIAPWERSAGAGAAWSAAAFVDAPPAPAASQPDAMTAQRSMDEPPPDAARSWPETDGDSAVQRAGAASAAGGHKPDEHQLDELAEQLYGRLRGQLVRELMLDRERAGTLGDLQ